MTQVLNEKISIGGDATLCVGSDKYPYTIINFEKKVVTIQRDKILKENNKTTIVPNSDGEILFFKKYNKRWRRVILNETTERYIDAKSPCLYLLFGEKKWFIDPSF